MKDVSDTTTDIRTLIYIPIIHTVEDLGSLADPVKSLSMKKIGRSGWKRKSDLIQKIWGEIELFIDKLDLPWDKTKIYQDGLPICDKEIGLVEELARAGSINHRLIIKLMDRGAAIMGTESLELLMEEYEQAKHSLNSKKVRPSAKETPDKALLRRRDKFIAERINQTLEPGETGIIFLGMLHSPDAWLAGDIRIIHPFK